MSDRGPAFPFKCQGPTTAPEFYYGMTLRDYFATAAMQGIVGSIDSEENYSRLRAHAKEIDLTVSQWIALNAYKQADAMLVERHEP